MPEVDMSDLDQYTRRERELDQQINQMNRQLEELENLGMPYDTRTGLRNRRNDLLRELQALPGLRQRGLLEGELRRAREGSAALNERAARTLDLGRRNIREGERLRLGQAETGLAALNLSESGLGERVRRAERESTAFAEADLESKVRIAEMDENFRAEQGAIERLYAHGENELAFHRQVQLLQMQAAYARELAEIESGNAFWNMLGNAMGVVGGVALMAANPFAGGAAAAAGGGDFLDKVL